MGLLGTDNVTNLLQKFLDVQSLRSQTIAGNIANADTPGYIAKEVDFEQFLKDAAQESALPPYQRNSLRMTSGPNVIEQPMTTVGMDGNTVDTGREMADLAQAGSSFSFGAKMLQSRLRLLRTAIREGK
ncbi:MAG: flagellar basal body rod protein FlgB [Pyrinomonadaceae bacterium]